MILRGFAFSLLLVTVLLLQTVVAPAAAVAGVVPNLVAVSVLAVGMMSDTGLGARYGFVAGLAVDVLAGPESVLGVSALLLLFAGYAAGTARPFIAASQLPGQVVVGGVGVAVYTIADELFEFMLGHAAAGFVPAVSNAVVGGVYAAVLTPVLCLVAGGLSRIAERPE